MSTQKDGTIQMKRLDGNIVDWGEAQDVVGSLPLPGSSRPSPNGPVTSPSASSARPPIPDDEREIIEDFMTVGEGISVADQLRYEASKPLGSSPRLSRISSRLSVLSTTTFLPSQGGYGGSLNDLTQLINNHTALYYATVVSTECYTEPIGLGIVHRFLIMELARPGKKTIWLGGSTEAHDTIQLSSSKNALFIKKARRENRQSFSSPPALSHLNRLLAVIVKTLSTYEIWPNNCWFFVSLLQKHLSVIGAGTFTFGGAVMENLDLATRALMDEEVERRTEDTIQRLNTVLTLASTSQQDLSLVERFPHLDIALYVRHVFQDVPLKDHSLVDCLIDLVEDSFSHAVVACRFVRYGPAQAHHYAIRTLVDHQTNILSLPRRMFDHTLANLDSELFSLLEADPGFQDAARNVVDWKQLHGLHSHITRICLNAMNNLLRPNICLILSSYMPTTGVDTQELVKLAHREGKITSALIYACSHWAYHASFAALKDGEGVSELVVTFLQHRALQWLEIISLIRKNASNALRPLSESNIPDGQLKDTVSNLAAFIEIFSEPIAQSVPHIYLSASLFSPLDSFAQKNLTATTGLRLTSHQSRSWDTLRLVSQSPEDNTSDDYVRGLAFSSDSSRILYICNDALRAWNVCNGDITALSLEGFESSVSPENAFSADENRVVAVNDNDEYTFLQLWDSKSGAKIGPSLIGHEGKIWSVAFSCNGKLIASGSSDGEIRLWDAHGPKAMNTPRMGHVSGNLVGVESLAFSPDDKQLVSGGVFGSVCVWDVSTGLQGWEAHHDHSESVTRVIYSPDGKQIASGSFDYTVRVWDAETGILCFGALKHDDFDSVYSVAYSPDGKHLASGGFYGNIHIWDSQSGEHLQHLKVGENFEQIAFAPNGKKLACRTDSEIHVWELDKEGLGPKDSNGLLASDEIKDSSILAIPRNDFNLGKLPLPKDLKVDDDGWLRGTGGELIVWVPPGLRNKVQSQAHRIIEMSDAPTPTVIDFGDFVGERWAEIFSTVSDETE